MKRSIEKIELSNGDTDFLDLQKEERVSTLSLMGDPSHSDLLWEDYLSDSDLLLTSEDHGTIRISSEAGRYRVSMVMKTLVAKYFALGGLGIKEYWILFELLESIRGSKHIFEIKDEYERHIAYISLLILKYGKINGLRFKEQVDIRQLLDLCPELKVKVTSPRIYHSLKIHWHWSRIITISIVPVDFSILVRNDHTTKYDSYTRGYGEGSHRAQCGKTPFSSELDGEETERKVSPSDDPILFRLFTLLTKKIFRTDPSASRSLE